MFLDLEELIHLMHDQPQGRMVRCSKARAMFASRSCRKSVMIGMPLTQTQMITVCSFLYYVLRTIDQCCSQPGHATYGDDGPAMELSSWQTDDASSCRPPWYDIKSRIFERTFQGYRLEEPLSIFPQFYYRIFLHYSFYICLHLQLFISQISSRTTHTASCE